MALPPPTDKQARIIWMSVTALAVGILLALLVGLIRGLGWLLNLLSPVLWPLAIGSILAYLLDPVVDFGARRGVPRGLAIILVFALVVVALTAFFASIIPRMVRERGRLISAVPGYSSQLQTNLNRWMSSRPFLETWRGKLFSSSRAKPPSVCSKATKLTLLIGPHCSTNNAPAPSVH